VVLMMVESRAARTTVAETPAIPIRRSRREWAGGVGEGGESGGIVMPQRISPASQGFHL
jgi:hypothetical protein